MGFEPPSPMPQSFSLILFSPNPFPHALQASYYRLKFEPVEVQVLFIAVYLKYIMPSTVQHFFIIAGENKKCFFNKTFFFKSIHHRSHDPFQLMDKIAISTCIACTIKSWMRSKRMMDILRIIH